MAKELKGTKTEQNLLEAFAGESMARNKYTYFASKARKDGYVQIAELFEATAANEKEHAKMWFKLLHDGKVTSVLTGASKPQQILDNIGALKNTHFSDEELKLIDEISAR
jgi:rubrerythrin